MIKKICCRCKKARLLKFFTKNKTKKDGYNPTCSACHRKYVKDHYDRNRKYYIDKANSRKETLRILVLELKDRPCTDCKKRYPPFVMDFDHVKGNKVFNLSKSWSNRGVQEIKEEAEKCDVVCANCHRIRTHKRRIAGSRSGIGYNA